MRPHILYRTISVTHLSAYLIHLKKVAIFDTNLISVGCVQNNNHVQLEKVLEGYIILDNEYRK